MTQQLVARGGDWVADSMNYEQFYKAGYRFAMRYVVPSINGKMVTAIEVSNAHAAKVDVGFVYETTGTTWQGGHSSGVDDGSAAQDAMHTINAPKGIAVYHAVDSQVPISQIPTVIQWLEGIEAGMPDYTVGCYGQESVMVAVAAALPHIKLWQTPAWSGGAIYPALELFQDSQANIGGLKIDTDSLYTSAADAGFWLAESPPPPPKDGQVDNIISQTDWRYCHKCKGLFYGPEEADSKCPDGGTHDSSQSGNYVLETITGTEPIT
jgi:hypothetical protein